jgi:hypothetical protein
VTLVDIFTTTTTTNTDLLTQDYNLIGLPAVASVPEPSTCTLLGAGLLGLGCTSGKGSRAALIPIRGARRDKGCCRSASAPQSM